jgi:hypothetical protein
VIAMMGSRNERHVGRLLLFGSALVTVVALVAAAPAMAGLGTSTVGCLNDRCTAVKIVFKDPSGFPTNHGSYADATFPSAIHLTSDPDGSDHASCSRPEPNVGDCSIDGHLTRFTMKVHLSRRFCSRPGRAKRVELEAGPLFAGPAPEHTTLRAPRC